MARIYDNPKGFKIIEMSVDEAVNICGFGYENTIICDTCGKTIEDVCYYVAAINRLLCNKSLKNFIDNVSHHKEDNKYEIRHFEYYCNLLNINV